MKPRNFPNFYCQPCLACSNNPQYCFNPKSQFGLGAGAGHRSLRFPQPSHPTCGELRCDKLSYFSLASQLLRCRQPTLRPDDVTVADAAAAATQHQAAAAMATPDLVVHATTTATTVASTTALLSARPVVQLHAPHLVPHQWFQAATRALLHQSLTLHQFAQPVATPVGRSLPLPLAAQAAVVVVERSYLLVAQAAVVVELLHLSLTAAVAQLAAA